MRLSGQCRLSSRSTGRAWMTSPRELGLRMRIFKATRRRLWPAGGEDGLELFADGQTLGQSRRQASLNYFLLRRRNVVIQPPQFNRSLVHVINHVSGLG